MPIYIYGEMNISCLLSFPQLHASIERVGNVTGPVDRQLAGACVAIYRAALLSNKAGRTDFEVNQQRRLLSLDYVRVCLSVDGRVL